jgi:hypothetical protein
MNRESSSCANKDVGIGALGTPDVAKIAEQGASPSNRKPEIDLFVPVLDSTHGCPQGWTRTVGEIFHRKFNIPGKYDYDIMPLADDSTVTAFNAIKLNEDTKKHNIKLPYGEAPVEPCFLSQVCGSHGLPFSL